MRIISTGKKIKIYGEPFWSHRWIEPLGLGPTGFGLLIPDLY